MIKILLLIVTRNGAYYKKWSVNWIDRAIKSPVNTGLLYNTPPRYKQGSHFSIEANYTL